MGSRPIHDGPEVGTEREMDHEVDTEMDLEVGSEREMDPRSTLMDPRSIQMDPRSLHADSGFHECPLQFCVAFGYSLYNEHAEHW